MNIEITFQMTEKRLYGVGCFRDFRIFQERKHIWQSLSDNRKTSSYHVMRVPVSSGFLAV